MNLAQAMRHGATLGLDRLDAQLLLLHAMGRDPNDRAWLLAHDRDSLDEPAQAAFFSLCRRRMAGEPVAYLVGHKEFFGLRLAVDARVLVPRPDTELLVEWALELLNAWKDPAAGPVDASAGSSEEISVLDLGTGSGAIALALKKAWPAARVDAVDLSQDALAVAQANADALGLQVGFSHGSWLSGHRARRDLIVSNPPYIAQGDEHLAALGHEPRQALAAGMDGLQDLRTIIAQAPARLKPGGWLLLEHGWDQAAAVRSLLEAAGFAAVSSRRDLAGIERCAGGQWLEHR